MPSLFSNFGDLGRASRTLPSTTSTPESTTSPTKSLSLSSSSSEQSNTSFYNPLLVTSTSSRYNPPEKSLPPPPQTLQSSTLPLSHPLASNTTTTTTETPPSSSTASEAIRSSRVSSISSLTFSSTPPPDRPAPPPPRPVVASVPFVVAATSSSSSSSSTPSVTPSRPLNTLKDKRSFINRTLSFQGTKKTKQGPHPLNSTHSNLPTEACATVLSDSSSHSSHPHSHTSNSHTSSPIAQTVTSSTVTNSSVRSYKGSIKDSLKSRHLFNVKRYRRQRVPLPQFIASDDTSNLELTQQQQDKHLSDNHLPENPSKMQQVEYITGSQKEYEPQMYDRSTHNSNVPSTPTSSSTSTPAPTSPSPRRPPSIKRMRSRPTEIAISASTSPSISTSIATTGASSFPSLHAQSASYTIPYSNDKGLSKSNIYTLNSNKSNINGNHNQSAEAEEVHLHDHMNSKLSGPLPLSISAAQPLSSDEQQQHQQHQLQQHNHQHKQEPELEPAQTIPRKLHAKKAGSRSHLSREAKAIRIRIRKLWQDPRHPENFKNQHGPKNQYLLLEESLTGILQIVPLIIKNAKGTPSSLGHLHSAGFIEPSGIAQTPSPLTITINTAESSAGSTTALPSSPTLSSAPTNPPTNPSPRSSSSNPVTPARTHTRARTTSSNSASTISATRYQIATSILQPPEPNLTDVAQPTVRTPTNISLLGEPALSTIAASAAGSPNPTLDNSSSGPQLAESNKILISKLLSLSNNFKGAIRTLYEQQNEKVLRFDDYMILDLLMRWEQEADKEVPDSELKDDIVTSLVTLGATNALERYQITVGRVWEETEVILSSIRKICDLVELGRIYHHNDFDADDSEEDAVERDEEAKRTLYSTLLYHANGLVTVLGEFLECVSGIQRLVGTIKTQRKSSDGDQDDVSLSNRRPTSEYNYGAQDTAMDFLSDEPRPIKHLDPALMRKLKRKTPFKSIADKVRRSFSDFAKRSTNQLLTIFPPLGDGTNDGFNWDSYSDNEYDSEEWAPTDMDSSVIGDEDAYTLALSPPDSPSVTSERPRHQLHRRLSSKDSSVPEQYWPGSIRVGLSDDNQSPSNPSSPVTTFSTTGTMIGGQSMAMSRSRSSERSVDAINMRFIPGPDTPPVPKLPETASYFPVAPESPASPSPSAKERRRSVQLFRKNSQASNIKGAYISSPIPAAPRPFSVYSSGSESQTPSRHNYRVRPPKPPTVPPPVPPIPPSTIHSSSYFKADEIMQDSANFKRQPSNKQASSYLATRSTSPQQAIPPTLESHFVRRTSIRMANRKRYSIKMPSDEVSDQEVPDINNIPSTVFWRRRSYNDALEKSWQALQLEALNSNRSENSALSTPVTAEFAPGSRSSVRLSSFEFPIPYGPKDTKFNRLSSRSISSSPRSSLYSKYDNRRHSSPLTPSAENALAEALSHRASVPFRQSMQSSSPMSPNNRNSIGMMPTLNEGSAHKRHIPRPSRSIDQLNFVEVDSLNIPVRTRLYQRDSSFEGVRVNSKSPMQDSKDAMENDVQPTSETPQQPISPSRYNDMKRAWEILNLDVKRVNQYSDLRAYAKVNNVQNNSWAYSHPNAHQSTSRPHAIVIREKGEDVLILEKMDERLQVVAGVLENLIERLADQNEQDGEYVSCFLLSHSFFIDSEELLDRLIARFNIQPRQGEMLYFNQWQKVIQCKVLCVLNRWIQIQFEDFELNQELLKTLRKFLDGDVRKCGFVIEADCIEKNINIRSRSPKKNCSVIMEQGRFCLQRTRTRKISISKSQSRLQSPTYLGLMATLMEPTPALPMEQTFEYGHPPDLLSTSPILSLTALELARYLTLADMKAFRCITVFELMSGWWKRRRSAESKNADDAEGSEQTDDGAIEAFTRRANMLSYWVAHEIVSLASTKHRKQLIKKFIEVAKICRDLSNLHTAMFIISALISPPVRRLHASWKMVSSTDMETLRQLEKLFDFSGNMRYYRQIIGEAQAPMIPFLPILLKDITFILDGNPTMTTSKSYVDQTPLPVSGTATAAAEAVPTDPSVEVSSETSTSSLPTSPEKSGTDADKSSAEKGLLVNFEKFRQLTQYVENAVDMAKCLDYWFEPQLLRQAQVFRPTSPSIHCGTSNDTDSIYGSISSGRGGSNSPLDSSRGALDYVSEIVEHRLVKASGLYGAPQKIVEVEFSSKPKNTSLWKGVVNVGGIVSSGLGSGGSNVCTNGSSVSETVIRAVQGEEEYLMGLSLMCEPRS